MASFPPHRSAPPLAQQRLLLPIHRHKKQILFALETFDLVVIVGETGCGKSTQIPQYCCEGGWAESDFAIVCAEPRRIAAIALAHRVTQECHNRFTVGCEVPLQSAVRGLPEVAPTHSSSPSIKYVTDEILLREAWRDPLLSSYSVVVVDDAHERTAATDLVLGLLKKIRRKRPSLRIVCCSATIDAEALVDFFGDGAKSTIVSVDGRQHPVDVFHLAQPAQNYLQATLDTCHKICRRGDPGDVLCFLPTPQLVNRALQMANEQDLFPHQTVDLLPLHGALPYQQQLQVFTKTNPKKRVIIFATSIAETSITVLGIRHVVDSGLTQLHYFDPSTGLDRSITTVISQATAHQRAGRAGRVDAGKCYRLYTEPAYQAWAPQTPPELVRTNLTHFILTLKGLGVDNVLAFDLMSAPPVENLSHGLETLFALGAIDEQTHLTALGRDLSCFAVEPRIARMLLHSLDLGCAWDALGVASALLAAAGGDSGEASGLALWNVPPQTSRSHQRHLDYQASLAEMMDPSGDHLTYVNVLAEFEQQHWNQQECHDRFLNYTALRRCREIRQHLAGLLRAFGNVHGGMIDPERRSINVRKCVCAGFFFNVCKLANDGKYYTLRKQVAVAPSPSSVLSLSSHATSTVSTYILFGDSVDGPRGGIELRSVSKIEAQWLRELAPHYWE